MKPRNSIALVLGVLCIFCGAAFSQGTCDIGSDDRTWVGNAITSWKLVRKDSLGLSPATLPWLILFNDSCVIHINPNVKFLMPGSPTAKPKIARFGGSTVSALIVSHNGKIALPEGGEVPADLLSFAAPYDQGRASFLISALPSVWRKAPHLQNEPNVDKLATSVFVHEMTHTLHRGFYGRLNEIEKRIKTTDEIDDDLIQKRFEKLEEFRAMVEAERTLLYAAAAAPDRVEKRRLAVLAFKSIDQRRKQYFSAETAALAELEDVFLTMEGAANWAAFRSAMDQGLGRPDALKLIRRGGKYWSQDLGLALFLVIDDLLPHWQRRAFATRNATVLELLGDAVK